MPSEISVSKPANHERISASESKDSETNERPRQVESKKPSSPTVRKSMQGDLAYIQAARQGIVEEQGYVGKIGRASELAMKSQLTSRGELVSDLNQIIKKNNPVLDLSTNRGLFSVKGTNAETWQSQFSYLKKGFDDLYNVDSRFDAKRRSAAAALASHSAQLHLPSDYPLPQDLHKPSKAELGAGAGYIQQNGQYAIPSDIYAKFVDEIRPQIAANHEMYGLQNADQVDSFLRDHVIANDLSTSDARRLLNENMT